MPNTGVKRRVTWYRHPRLSRWYLCVAVVGSLVAWRSLYSNSALTPPPPRVQESHRGITNHEARVESSHFSSCQQKQSVWDHLSTLSRSKWVCYNCTRAANAINTSLAGTSHPVCRVVQRNGHCPAFGRMRPFPPAVQYDDDGAYRHLTWLGHHRYLNQPVCEQGNCWDLARPACRNTTLFPIYINHTGPHPLVDYAVRHAYLPVSYNISRVDDYRQACLIVVTRDTYPTYETLQASEHWFYDVPMNNSDRQHSHSNEQPSRGGRNHLMWKLSRFPYRNKQGQRLTADAPFPLYDVGWAAVASESLGQTYLRPYYDLALPLRRQWGRASDQVDVHRNRPYLLAFRGSVQNAWHAGHQHRWLALEYWPSLEESDVVKVDVQCKYRRWLRHQGGFPKTIIKPYRLPASAYPDFLWNSTFGFAPGGSGVGSYRFGEILSVGGIPVVTTDFAPPLAPELDWSGCIVQVDGPDIIDLPQRLQKMPLKEIRQRQTKCWELLQYVFGDIQSPQDQLWYDDERVVFTRAMEIWAHRIYRAQQQQILSTH